MPHYFEIHIVGRIKILFLLSLFNQILITTNDQHHIEYFREAWLLLLNKKAKKKTEKEK